MGLGVWLSNLIERILSSILLLFRLLTLAVEAFLPGRLRGRCRPPLFRHVHRVTNQRGQSLLGRATILQLAATISGDHANQALGVDARGEFLPDAVLLG